MAAGVAVGVGDGRAVGRGVGVGEPTDRSLSSGGRAIPVVEGGVGIIVGAGTWPTLADERSLGTGLDNASVTAGEGVGLDVAGERFCRTGADGAGVALGTSEQATVNRESAASNGAPASRRWTRAGSQHSRRLPMGPNVSDEAPMFCRGKLQPQSPHQFLVGNDGAGEAAGVLGG